MCRFKDIVHCLFVLKFPAVFIGGICNNVVSKILIHCYSADSDLGGQSTSI